LKRRTSDSEIDTLREPRGDANASTAEYFAARWLDILRKVARWPSGMLSDGETIITDEHGTRTSMRGNSA
jgi:hypothetical protein